MKIVKSLALSLLLALSSYSFAEQTQAQSVSSPTSSTQIVNESVQAHKVNINTATAAELQDKLVGIGQKKAQAIVDYRTKNGNFSSIEQLSEVSGIGQATVEKNRANIILE